MTVVPNATTTTVCLKMPLLFFQTEFRLFWLKSKLIENPESGRVSKVNPVSVAQISSQ